MTSLLLVWLCVTVSVIVWPWGDLLSPHSLSDLVWCPQSLSDLVWHFQSLSDFVWPFWSLSDLVWPRHFWYDLVRHCLTLRWPRHFFSDLVWHFQSLFDLVWPRHFWSELVWPCEALSQCPRICNIGWETTPYGYDFPLFPSNFTMEFPLSMSHPLKIESFASTERDRRSNLSIHIVCH